MERTEEERLPGARIRARPRAARERRPLRAAEYLRNGSEKNVGRRAGEVKERARTAAREAREEAHCYREIERERERRAGKRGGRSEPRRRVRPGPAEFYPKLSATSSPLRPLHLDIFNLPFYISPLRLPLLPSRLFSHLLSRAVVYRPSLSRRGITHRYQI